MYINFQLLRQINLSVSFIPILFAANQNRTSDESLTLSNELFADDLKQLFELGILEQIKPKKKSDTVYNLTRLSAKGKKLLEDITTPEILQGDIQMFDYLVQIYLSHDDKDRVVGNAKKVKMYCAILRNHLQMTLHEFYYFIELFLSDYPFTKRLENLFLDPNKVRYGTFINNVDASPIFQYWQKEEDNIRHYWANKIKTEE
jgi:hypothetical protein